MILPHSDASIETKLDLQSLWEIFTTQTGEAKNIPNFARFLQSQYPHQVAVILAQTEQVFLRGKKEKVNTRLLYRSLQNHSAAGSTRREFGKQIIGTLGALSTKVTLTGYTGMCWEERCKLAEYLGREIGWRSVWKARLTGQPAEISRLGFFQGITTYIENQIAEVLIKTGRLTGMRGMLSTKSEDNASQGNKVARWLETPTSQVVLREGTQSTIQQYGRVSALLDELPFKIKVTHHSNSGYPLFRRIRDGFEAEVSHTETIELTKIQNQTQHFGDEIHYHESAVNEEQENRNEREVRERVKLIMEPKRVHTETILRQLEPYL